MATTISTGDGDLGAIASTPSAHTSVFNGGTFTGVDPDETLVPAEEGAVGVINPDVTGPAQVGDASGPTPAR